MATDSFGTVLPFANPSGPTIAATATTAASTTSPTAAHDRRATSLDPSAISHRPFDQAYSSKRNHNDTRHLLANADQNTGSTQPQAVPDAPALLQPAGFSSCPSLATSSPAASTSPSSSVSSSSSAPAPSSLIAIANPKMSCRPAAAAAGDYPIGTPPGYPDPAAEPSSDLIFQFGSNGPDRQDTAPAPAASRQMDHIHGTGTAAMSGRSEDMQADPAFGPAKRRRIETAGPAAAYELMHPVAGPAAHEPIHSVTGTAGPGALLGPAGPAGPAATASIQEPDGRSSAASSSQTNVQAHPLSIDLTNDDDAARATAKSPADEEVCLGMINTKLVCHLVPSPKPGQTSIFGDGYWPAVRIVLRRIDGDTTITISGYDHTRKVVGRLDVNTAGCLAPLLDAPHIGLRAECRIPTQAKRPGQVPGSRTNLQAYPLEATLYSRIKWARGIGKHLLVYGISLVVPSMVPPGIRVLNPHGLDPRPPPPPPPARIAAAAAAAGDRQKSPANAAAGSGPAAAAGPAAGSGGSGSGSGFSFGPGFGGSGSGSGGSGSGFGFGPSRTVDDIKTEVMGVFDSLTQNDELPEAEPPATVITPLLTHQKQGLFFLLSRERGYDFQLGNKHMTSFWKAHTTAAGETRYRNVITSEIELQPPPVTRGGILADMMGLGKTLTVLSLVMCSLGDAAAWAARPPVQPRLSVIGRAADTPSPAMPQPLGLTAVRRNVRTTLLVCPLSTVTNWEEQIKQHIAPDRLSVHIYHGAGRFKDYARLAEFDLVITTYGSVSSELSARSKQKSGLHPLEEVAWFRIVLDEAHMIREHNTLQFKAIYRLQASRRWAVTGTPIQNRLDDFAALLAFLRLKPFDDRAKFLRHIVDPFRSCDPEVVPRLRVLVDTITLRRLKDKINLPARVDEVIRLDFSAEERRIYDLFAKNAQDRVQALAGQGRDRVMGGHSYIHILRSILRLRLLCAHGKDLLNDEDLATLQGMTADTAIDIEDDDDGDDGHHGGNGGGGGGGAEAPPTLTERQAYEMFRLMQDTNIDFCVDCGKKIGAGAADAADMIDPDGQQQQQQQPDDIIGHMNPCFHVVCKGCFRAFRDRCRLAAGGGPSGPCPVCQARRPIVFVDISRSKAEFEHENRADTRDRIAAQNRLSSSNYGGPHTKTRALVDELLKLKAQSATVPNEPPFRSVVFSGWTSHLDLIQLALGRAGITYTRLDGTMTRAARAHAMDAFRTDPRIDVILVSIMAGGLGLNLTAGNSVFVMEPQFNPAAEAQAVDRVHRLGQTRPVRTVRFIMRGSFEEKMIELQDKKMKLASLSMDGKGRALDKAEAARQKLMDLRSLFR